MTLGRLLLERPPLREPRTGPQGRPPPPGGVKAVGVEGPSRRSASWDKTATTALAAEKKRASILPDYPDACLDAAARSSFLATAETSSKVRRSRIALSLGSPPRPAGIFVLNRPALSTHNLDGPERPEMQRTAESTTGSESETDENRDRMAVHVLRRGPLIVDDPTVTLTSSIEKSPWSEVFLLESSSSRAERREERPDSGSEFLGHKTGSTRRGAPNHEERKASRAESTTLVVRRTRPSRKRPDKIFDEGSVLLTASARTFLLHSSRSSGGRAFIGHDRTSLSASFRTAGEGFREVARRKNVEGPGQSA